MKRKLQIHTLTGKLSFVACAVTAVSTAQASTDYGPAIWRPACSGHWYAGYTARQVYVIHDMEGYYASTISYLQGCNNTVSVHYCVNGLKDAASDMPAGEITQMVRDADSAWTAGCWNRYAEQTEHEGFASNPAWYTPAMYQASAALTQSKANKYGIPKDRNHIIAHGQESVPGWAAWASANLSFNPYCNSHTDPGPYWDWAGYMNLVNQGSGPARGISPSLVVSASGTTVFAVHSDTSVRYNYQNSGWVSLGGSSFYNVKGVLTPDNRLVVFGTGNGGSVWYNYQTAPGGTWSGWINLGGGPFTSVKALVLADGRLAIFATSNSSALWHNYQTSPGGAWAGWVNLGGSGFHHIDPVLLPDGKMVVFGAGDGSPAGMGTEVYHMYQTSVGGPWTAWTTLGGSGFTYVRGLALADGRLVVFGCGNGSTVYHQFQSTPGGSWSGWVTLGGSGFSTIDPVLMSDGRMVLFGTGPSSSVFHTFQSSAGGPWSGWVSLGGSGFSTVDGGVLNDGRLVAFGNGNGGAFWYDGQTSAGGSWTGWINLGGVSLTP